MDNKAIAKIYADLVRAGRRQLEDVPEQIRDLVEQMLNAE